MDISNLPQGPGPSAFDDFEAQVHDRISAALSAAGAVGAAGAAETAAPRAPANTEPAPGWTPHDPATAAIATLVASAMNDPSRAADLPRQTLEILIDGKLSAQPQLNLPGARQALLETMASDPHILSELADIIVDLADRIAYRPLPGRP